MRNAILFTLNGNLLSEACKSGFDCDKKWRKNEMHTDNKTLWFDCPNQKYIHE